MKQFRISFYFFLLLNINVFTQTVPVGAGSYSTVIPSGAVGPQYSNGTTAIPKVSSTFTKPPQTCDYWSSLIYPFYGDQFSNVMYAHPLNYKAKNNGLQLGYTTTPVYAAQDYLFPFQKQLTVGVAGLNALKTVTDDYGDWTVTALWNDGTRTMKATLGHGLPYAFFTISGGNAIITCNAAPTIWFNQNGVLGITVEGRHYGIFAPDSSSWSGTTTLQSSLNNKNYFSVALLPNNNLATLEIYRKHAYAFVTGSTVEWNYDEASAKLTSTFSYTTELKESGNGNLNETLTALYRHQWLNTSAPLTSFEYISVAGKIKVFEGNQFTTELTFEGVLPALPDEGVYNPADLLAMVNDIATETLPSSGNLAGTYWNGKLIARFAHLVNIADQLGAITARDHFLNQIKTRLQDWFTAGGSQSYVYNSTWKTLTGYPSEFGADNQINDHNFHAGYAIMGAAIVAQYDSVWAANENWGGMVELLIKDGNNYDRNDTRFPFLRALDPYAGHSWESGHGDFGDGTTSTAVDTSHLFTVPGIYKVILTVTNQQLLSSKDSLTIIVNGNGTPYSGTPVIVPATIQAENFDNGGEGIAYHDVDANNIGLVYRPNDGVDIEPSSEQGFDVYWMVAGEWLEYTINVPADTLYDIIPYVATVPGFGNFRIFINNVDVSGKIQVTGTGGWQSWQPKTISNVPLQAGVQILRFEINTDYPSEIGNWLFSLNYIKVNLSGTVDVSDDNYIPWTYSLLQNYPNPFNPTSIIKFDLPVAGIITLEIYDILGRKVSTLINEHRQAGSYEQVFDASSLSSGVYVYKLQAGTFTSSKKLILLK